MSSQLPIRRSAGVVSGALGPYSELDHALDKIRSLVPDAELFPLDTRIKFFRDFRDLLDRRFQLGKTIEHLHEAISASEKVISLVGSTKNSVGDLSTLATMKTSRYEITQANEDLDDAIALGRQAKQLCQPHEPVWSHIVNDLGYSLSARFRSRGQMIDLDEAISCCREAMTNFPPETFQHKSARFNLGPRLVLRASVTKDPAHLDESLEVNRRILKEESPSSHEYVLAHQNTAQALLDRYMQTNDLWDLIEAIQLQRVVVDKIAQGERMWSSSRQCLAYMLRTKYQHTNDPSCLQEAAKLSNEHQLPPSHSIPHMPDAGPDIIADALPGAKPDTEPDAEQKSNFLDNIPANNSGMTLRQALKGALTVSPDGDALAIPGVRYLPKDELGGKMAHTINELAVPPDERYAGPMSWAEYIARESQLEYIFLEIDGHYGQTLDTYLCRVCRRLGLVAGNRFTDKEWLKWRPFGTWASIQARGRCMLCQLVVRCLSDGSGQRLHPRLQNIDPEVAGVQLCSEQLPSGEQYLAVEYGFRRAGAIRILDQNNYTTLLRQGFQAPHSDVRRLLRNGSSPILSRLDQCASISRIKAWLSECQQNHGKKCTYVRASSSTTQSIAVLLVDVRRNCLVRATSAERYFALSYVWGDTQMPKTMRTNLEARMMPNSLPQNLPSTIKDAMILVHELGEQYLWADVLCIVQDDPQQKHDDIQQMDLVYSHALATIVGIHGENADAGLPGIRPGTRKPQVVQSRAQPIRLSGPNAKFVQQFNRAAQISTEEHEKMVTCHTIGVPLVEASAMMEWLAEAIKPGGPANPVIEPPRSQDAATRRMILDSPSFQAMVPHPPSLEYALRCSIWHTRGWTFQERHLSAACIYFSSDFVYFQCGEMTRCEAGGDLLPWPDVSPPKKYPSLRDLDFSSWPDVAPSDNSLSKLDTPQPVETNPILALASCASPTLPASHDSSTRKRYEHKRHRFDVYREIVESYSKLRLSFPSDMLNAFAGIARVLGRHLESDILSGLPACYLDHALLWATESPCARRVDTSAYDATGLVKTSFPSWSWAGWTNTMRYLLADKGKSTWHRENYEYAQSEIDRFQVLHGGTLYEAYKSKERMEAAETRFLGEMPKDKPIEETYPVYLGYVERRTLGVSGPDLGPGALWFWTFTVDADAFNFDNIGPGHIIVDQEHGNVLGKHRVTRMFDRNKVHCGLMMSFRFENADAWHRREPGVLEWILISSFWDAHNRRSGLPTVDTTVRAFDEKKLPYKGKGSGLVNLMLIEWDNEVAERITVAQVHRQVWEAAKPVRKHIRLV